MLQPIDPQDLIPVIAVLCTFKHSYHDLTRIFNLFLLVVDMPMPLVFINEEDHRNSLSVVPAKPTQHPLSTARHSTAQVPNIQARPANCE